MRDPKRVRRVAQGAAWWALLGAVVGRLAFAEDGAATLKVVSSPAGATVSLDGVHIGTSPCEVSGVGHGWHLVRATKYRHATATQKVQVAQPVVEVNLKLTPQGRGSLRFAVKPERARVIVNGQSKGETPLTLSDLAPGRYEVRIEADWFLPWQGAVEVVEGKESVVEQELGSKTEAYLLAAIDRDPGRIVNYYDLGHLYARLQRFDEAFEAFGKGFDACRGPDISTNEMRRVYDEFERLWDGQYNFADGQTRASLHGRQLEALRAAIKRKPRNVLNYYLLSQFHFKRKEYAAAAEVLERGWQAVKSPRCKLYLEHYLAYMRYYEGVGLQKQKQYDQAIQVFEKLVEQHPNVYYTRSALSQAASLWQSYKKDVAKAIETKRQFVELYPDSDQAPGVLASIASLYQSQLKDYPKAIETFREHVDRFPGHDSSPGYLLSIASLYSGQLKDPDSAAKVCHELITKYPHYDGVASALGTLYHLDKAKKEEKSAELVRTKLLTKYAHSSQAAQLETDEERKALRRESATAYSAAAKLARTDKPAAIEAYSELVNKYAWTNYARSAQEQIISLWRGQKNYGKEIEARRRFIQLFPEDDRCANHQYQIGYTLCDRVERIDEGAAELRRVIDQYPDSDLCATAQYQLASVYTYSGKHYSREKYIAENERYVREYPRSDNAPAAQRNVAMNFYYQFLPGDLERGRAELLKVIQRYPWSFSAASAEYYLDMLDAGMQLGENRLP